MASEDLNLNHTELSVPILATVKGDMDSPLSLKLGLILNFIPSILSVIAFIVAIIALTQHNGGGNITVNSSPNLDSTSDRIWTIALGDSKNNQEYIDEKSGGIMGFQPDLVDALCTIANKNCRMVFDLHINCWDAEAGQSSHGGAGLFSGWYDACVGWTASVTRQRTFKFSDPHAHPSGSAIVVQVDNPGNLDWKDLREKKIGFLDGWASDKVCLGQIDTIQGSNLRPEQVFQYVDINQLIDALKTQEIDAGFVSNSAIQDRPEITVLQGGMDWTCHGSAGIAVMMRKDNALDDWWNPALKRLMSTTKYRQICQDVKDAHGHMPGLDPEDFCIGI